MLISVFPIVNVVSNNGYSSISSITVPSDFRFTGCCIVAHWRFSCMVSLLSFSVIAFADDNKFTLGTKIFANGERVVVIDLLGYHLIFSCLLGLSKSRSTDGEDTQLFRLRVLSSPPEETTIALFETSSSESLSFRDVIIEATLEVGADVLHDSETLIGLESGCVCSDSRLSADLLDNWILFFWYCSHQCPDSVQDHTGLRPHHHGAA